MRILEHLFTGPPLPVRLLEAADVNDDGWVGITDPIRIFDYANRGGPPPMPPFPRFGCDPTP
jgi:hypothetical protein